MNEPWIDHWPEDRECFRIDPIEGYKYFCLQDNGEENIQCVFDSSMKSREPEVSEVATLAAVGHFWLETYKVRQDPKDIDGYAHRFKKPDDSARVWAEWGGLK